MSKKDDIIKVLLEREEGVISHINNFILDNYRADLDQLSREKEDELYRNRAVYEKYLETCFTKFCEFLLELENDLVAASTEGDYKKFSTAKGDYEKFSTSGINWFAPAVIDKKAKIPESPLTSKLNPSHADNVENFTYFRYIAKNLDLNDKTTCELLPYLLTAYTCHAPRNQLVRSEGFDKIFNSSNPEKDTYEGIITTRRRRQIKTLSNSFSFKCRTILGKEDEEESRKAETKKPKSTKKRRPKPHTINLNRPYNDILIKQQVFAAWVAITTAHLENGYKEIKHKIDLRSCALLFIYYTEQDMWEQFPDDLTLENTPSNEYLKESLQSHFETGSLTSLWELSK